MKTHVTGFGILCAFERSTTWIGLFLLKESVESTSEHLEQSVSKMVSNGEFDICSFNYEAKSPSSRFQIGD